MEIMTSLNTKSAVLKKLYIVRKLPIERRIEPEDIIKHI